MEPLPDEAPPGAYGGSRLASDLETPEAHAFAGRGELAPAEPSANTGSVDAEILPRSPSRPTG